ncbi:MAG: DEAD/DEAH box helicase [Candidatus Bathyarchaeota archaeon]|nr:DEAD/DEAH box helicase [Candidatus Bathyarchaeota archaeon]
MSLISRVISWFQGVQIIPISLEFEVDYQEGLNEIRVYRFEEDSRTPVRDVNALWRHGFIWETDKIKHVLSRDDFDTLLALRALNAKITEEGVITSQVYPSVLNYLREKEKIEETEASNEIIIHEKPLPRVAKLSYTQNEGIEGEIGYQRKGKDELILKGDLQSTPDPEYSRIENEFYLTPVEENDQIRKYIDSEQFYIPDIDIPEFLKRDLAFLKLNFNAVLLGGIETFEVLDEEMVPLFSLNMGDKGWLDFVVNYQIGEHILPLDLFQNGKNGYVKIGDKTWAKYDENQIKELQEQLNELGVQFDKDGLRTDITKFQSLEELIAHIGGLKSVSEEYQRFEDELTGFEFDFDYRLPDDLEKTLVSNGIDLRGYQRAGIQWLNWLSDHYLHGILADDMGLGKTIQSIINMRLNYYEENPDHHSLIICPRSVLRFWEREIRKAWVDARIKIYHGPMRNSKLFFSKNPRIFITTYATATNDVEILQKVPFYYLILDEGTRIKNPQAKRSKAIKSLNAAHRFVLSGTPIENRPAELWSLFDFLMKGHLGSYGGFVSKIEKPIIDGDQEKAKYLAKRINPFVLRRLKKDVAKDLPDKIPMNGTCSLTTEQRALYGQIQDLNVNPIRVSLQKGVNVSRINILAIITKLKQVCDHPALITGNKTPIHGRSEKFDIFCEKIQEIVDSEDQVVLFSHFLGTLDLFERFVVEAGLSYIRIDGSTRNRQELIDRFNEQEINVALCSLLAAGQGITLTGANHVLHVDRWWNPAVEDQATDRVHRIGQKKTVFVHHVLTEGTLEERIEKILEKKRGIADSVLSATGGFAGWTREELLELLEPLKI